MDFLRLPPDINPSQSKSCYRYHFHLTSHIPISGQPAAGNQLSLKPAEILVQQIELSIPGSTSGPGCHPKLIFKTFNA